MADRAVWLVSGEMMKIGRPEDVTTEFTVGFDLRTEDKVEIGQPLIKIDNARRYYYSYTRGVVKAVDDVSLEVGEKEIVGLVGLSGAGKTTLSRMIAGICEPSGGSITVRVGDDST